MHDVHMKCGCTIVIVQCKVVCFSEILNVKAVVAAFNQEEALVGAFSVITNLRMKLFEALIPTQTATTTAFSSSK